MYLLLEILVYFIYLWNFILYSKVHNYNYFKILIHWLDYKINYCTLKVLLVLQKFFQSEINNQHSCTCFTNHNRLLQSDPCQVMICQSSGNNVKFNTNIFLFGWCCNTSFNMCLHQNSKLIDLSNRKRLSRFFQISWNLSIILLSLTQPFSLQ